MAAGLLARNAVAKGLDVEAVGEDLARARLAGGRGISREVRPAEGSRHARLQPGRLRLHHLHRQFRSAAGRNLRSINKQDLRRGRGAFRQPQFRRPRQCRTCARIISPRRRWSSPMRSPARCNVDLTKDAARHRQGRARRSISRTSGRPASEIASVIRKTITKSVFARKYADVFKGDANWRKIAVKGGMTLQWDDRSTYVQNPPYFAGMAKRPHADRRHRRRAHARPVPRLRSPPTTSRRPARSRRRARPATTCSTTRCGRSTSTSTARGAATTK